MFVFVDMLYDVVVCDLGWLLVSLSLFIVVLGVLFVCLWLDVVG